ncbi:hypothetical protein O3G_MSEX014504 [Manduca sexta]|uniref:DM13 domain-containing protein n=1 Tax=Manduca sexta TaxID=7130 RepID=A0A921ZUK3_MANSE|nr:hypothetical protein O3G_MSEX014504 [Manduca sexta]
MLSEYKMLSICFLVLAIVTKDCSTQDEDGPYLGKSIGKLNSYHHQVSGEVYAVDDWTILLVNFNYDGTGDDTFFWAGDSGRPGPQGFIVPDQHGKTNVLERYYNEEVRLTLPEGKRVSRLKWFAVYDIDSQNAFGDVYVPDEFTAPAPQSVGPLAGSPAVSSKPVRFIDANTFIIPEFRYDGSGEEVYFWTGNGPQASSRGMKIPDEHGYLEPLRARTEAEVRLELPGGRAAGAVDWVSVWDAGARRSLGSVLVPDALNVPPAPRRTHPYVSALPNCRQLHRDYQMGEDEYMAFGISGSDTNSSMLGADVAVARFSGAEQRGFATDYNITALAPCVQVLGQWLGVCRDDALGGVDSNQVFTARRERGVTVVSYRRTLQPEGATYVVWAIGRLDADNEPSFHRLYPTSDVKLHLSQQPPENDCTPFTVPTAAGPLCLARHAADADARRDDRFATFRAFNRSLQWSCAPGPPGELLLAPNSSWPDVVYYHSFTHADMGGRIYIVDRHNRNIGRKNSAAQLGPYATLVPLVALSVVLAALTA